MPLNVCVCGWYFYDDWYASLLRLQDKGIINVHIVANRIHPALEVYNLPYTVRENKGLEWGAYNHYIQKIWQGGNTIFCHDDMAFQPVLTEKQEVVSGEDFFYRLAELDIDQGYVFNSRQEDAENWGKHGRMLYMSHRLIEWCKNDEIMGIWRNREKENHNAGINGFDELMRHLDGGEPYWFDTCNKIYFPGIAHGYRGEFKGRVIHGNHT